MLDVCGIETVSPPHVAGVPGSRDRCSMAVESRPEEIVGSGALVVSSRSMLDGCGIETT